MPEETNDSHEMPNFLKEKRCMFDRFPSRFPAKFKDTRDTFGANVQLRNISAEGAKITTKEHVYLNDSISLDVELPDGKGVMTIRGEVVWTEEKDVDLWDVGLKFHKVVFMDLWRICKSAGIDLAD